MALAGERGEIFKLAVGVVELGGLDELRDVLGVVVARPGGEAWVEDSVLGYLDLERGGLGCVLAVLRSRAGCPAA